MDNSDLYKVWYVIMRALEYGPLKSEILHLDQYSKRMLLTTISCIRKVNFILKLLKGYNTIL